MLSTHGDEVTVIDIIEGGCAITEHGDGIGVGLVAVRRHVTTSEHRIVDHHASLRIRFLVASVEFFPCACPVALTVLGTLDIIQVFCNDIVILIV